MNPHPRHVEPNHRHAKVGPLGALAWRLLALLLSLAATRAALAAPAPDFEYRLNARIGWNDAVLPDRWCPLRVTISGTHGEPLAKPIGGTLLVRYVQDATQGTELRLAVATTPGRVAQIDGAICLPRQANWLELNLLSDDGELLARQVFKSSANAASGELPMPRVAAVGCLATVTDGSVNLPDKLLKQWRRRDDAFDPSMRVLCERIRPENFPVESQAFQGVRLLVVDASGAFDERTIAAVRQWVLSGGRLVLIATRDGDNLKSWLALGPRADLLRFDEPLSLPVPESVALAAKTPILSVRITPQIQPLQPPSDDPATPAPSAPEAPSAPPDDDTPAAAEVPATPGTAAESEEPPDTQVAAAAFQRRISLTPRARAEGWKLRWPTDTSGEQGLLAEGPMGFGHVAVLGIDPRRALKGAADTDSMGLWRDALDGVLSDEAPPGDSGSKDEYNFQVASGDSFESSTALQRVLDDMVDVDPLDSRVFLAIGAAMLALALLVGPGDYFLFRSPVRRHRSWMSALLWVCLASAASYLGPSLLRDSRTQVRRLSVIDAIQGDQPGTPSLAFQTSATSIWAGSTRNASVLGPDGRPLSEANTDGSWWRGISGIPLSWNEQSSTFLPGTRFLQRPPGIDSTPDPWGGIDPARTSGTLPIPEGFTLRTWTLRTFLDDARVTLPLFATVISESSGKTVKLGGLPPGATITSAAAHLGDDWYELHFELAGSETIAKLGSPLAKPGSEHPATLPEGSRWRRASTAKDDTFAVPWDHTSDLSIPGVDRRTLATNIRATSGSWMTLCLHLKNMPMDVTLDGSPDCKRQAVVRLSVPLERLP